MAIWDRSAQLWIEDCYKCKTRFGMSETVYRATQERKGELSFYCPNGHGQVYTKGDSEETKLRRECDLLKQDAARLNDRIREEAERALSAERRAAGYKGIATKMKNRIKAGVCPCCNRTFHDLARHIASKHPDIDNVVEFKAVGGPQ